MLMLSFDDLCGYVCMRETDSMLSAEGFYTFWLTHYFLGSKISGLLYGGNFSFTGFPFSYMSCR